MLFSNAIVLFFGLLLLFLVFAHIFTFMVKNYCLVEATVLIYATLLSYCAHATSYWVTIGCRWGVCAYLAMITYLEVNLLWDRFGAQRRSNVSDCRTRDGALLFGLNL